MLAVGMEEEDRRNITRNIGHLVENTNIDILIPKLLEKGVFSSMMIEKYLPSIGLNAQQRKTALYLDIQRRGPLAFQKLIDSFVETEQYELAKLLKPDLHIQTVSNRQESVTHDALPSGRPITGTTVSNLPVYFSNHLENHLVELTLAHPNAVVNLNTDPLRVVVKYGATRFDHNPPKPHLPVYQMGSRPKGYFLMINNIRFVNDIEDERTGAEVDDLNLSVLFQELGYEVKSYTDLNLEDMKFTIKQFSEMEEHKHVNSCVVAILSHGHSGTEAGSTDFVASDGGRLSSAWVLECFNNYHCPNLMGRPKIFIFQTCRGRKEDFGVQPRVQPRPRIATDGYPASQVRSYSDMLIAYSTIPGYVSNRDIYCGTWYIQLICKVFMEHAHDTEIQDMLTMVDNNMRHLVAENSSMQTSSFENWGFRKFYFNPGLYDDDTNRSDNSVNDPVPESTV